MVWRDFYDWNMDCNSFRNTDEYPGSVEYTGDKTVQSVGIDRMGAADGVLVCVAAWFLQEEIRLEHCGRLKTNIRCLEEFWEHLSL